VYQSFAARSKVRRSRSSVAVSAASRLEARRARLAACSHERFEYFRLADRVIKGQASPREILEAQERFDNHFLDVPAWRTRYTSPA
jgi:hypothetical protein